MTAQVPRVVLITRASAYQELLRRHGTHEQGRFFLETRGLSIEPLVERHQRLEVAVVAVQQAVPKKWRQARVDRADLDRFVFEPEDLVVAVGQDGLVANCAKYLNGQLVLGINPDPGEYEGILVPHQPEVMRELLEVCLSGEPEIESRTMVQARLDDGQELLALNEIFVGHRTHQSARYRIDWQGQTERQSSSGLIVASGTGATGWALSIHRQRHTRVDLPGPADPRLAFFVREPWPSVSSGTDLTEGVISSDDTLEITSEMNADGVLFGDGIEADRIDFSWGRAVEIGVSKECLRLVTR